MTQTLYLVRHGRTALNAEGRLRGLADPPLDAVGVEQAFALGRALARVRPGRVLSSPLQRAVHTGRLIAEAAGVACTPDPRFNDRDYGPWTGHLQAEVVAEWGTVDAAPGVEPIEQVLTRVLPALDAVLDDAGGRSVVAVTHDAVIRAVIRSIDPARDALLEPNGCWNELARMGNRWSVLAVDRLPGPAE